MARNKGFSLLEVIIILVVLTLIGLLGWRFWQANQSSSSTTPTTTQTDDAPTIKSDADLDKATQTLDNTNVEGNESKQLDSQTSF